MKQGGSRRSNRLGDQIMRELAELLVEEVRDPRLELVSISGVAMNADMSIARVMYTLSGDEKRLADAAKAFEQAKGFLRSSLGKRLRLRYLPDLRFARDEFLEEMVYAHPSE